MNDLNSLITSLRPDTEDAYQRRRDADLARVFATPRRRALSFRLRLLAAAAPVALAGIVAAYVLAPNAAPPPAGSISASALRQYALMSSEGPGISIALCRQDDPLGSCGGTTTGPAGGGTAITEQQKADLYRTLRDLPGVESVTFQDRATAYAKVREDYKESNDLDLFQKLKMADMAESFTVVMEPGAAETHVISKVQDMPGVAVIVVPLRE
ncbi:permease-like cell division protein FtsX [Spongiactinospora rosea]|uniref:permease-like cell division protein FtsX n=1 Tax=Spongiactinospora rosea TaxID=2248750 RepID=UPI0011C03102|nr:permease-like cell division protein FtsX [Spongiactinospora rosea]